MQSLNTTEGLLESIKKKRYFLFHSYLPIDKMVGHQYRRPNESIAIKCITIQATQKVANDITVCIKVNDCLVKTIILGEGNDFIVSSTDISMTVDDAMSVDIVHGFSPGRLTVKADF